MYYVANNWRLIGNAPGWDELIILSSSSFRGFRKFSLNIVRASRAPSFVPSEKTPRINFFENRFLDMDAELQDDIKTMSGSGRDETPACRLASVDLTPVNSSSSFVLARRGASIASIIFDARDRCPRRLSRRN